MLNRGKAGVHAMGLLHTAEVQAVPTPSPGTKITTAQNVTAIFVEIHAIIALNTRPLL